MVVLSLLLPWHLALECDAHVKPASSEQVFQRNASVSPESDPGHSPHPAAELELASVCRLTHDGIWVAVLSSECVSPIPLETGGRWLLPLVQRPTLRLRLEPRPDCPRGPPTA